uniref:Uncharacterized protein n=1 Tax=Panagrolaimus superbus TaxID=310955 RepID=A0A914Z5R8_9BILA
MEAVQALPRLAASEGEVLVPKIGGEDRHGHTDQVGTEWNVQWPVEQWQQPALEQDADGQGLQQADGIDGDEPRCLLSDGTVRALENQNPVQNEGRQHAQPVGQTDGNLEGHSKAEQDPATHVDRSCRAATDDEQEKLAAHAGVLEAEIRGCAAA